MEYLNRAACWATLVAFVVIAYLSIEPTNIAVVDDLNDKSKHVMAFFTLAIGLLHFWRLSWSMTALVLMTFGIGIEISQSFIPGRTATSWDVAANSAGFLLAWGIIKVFRATRVIVE